ncbi:peptidase [bacterium]|nr:peptidase [Mariniblastus sp.]MDB4468376.1 peptidase [bacterium]MDA7905823.1 peptidase [Mariniblastus sp.]MDB4372762.1 peptidase [Mariniblastus sp.]MDB4483719.1 peptidase [bacterium]
MVENNTKPATKLCKFFAIALCLAVSAEALGVLYQASSVPDATRPRPTKITKPAVIEFKGEIKPQLKMYFDNRFEMARRAGVDLLIIEIDSPGGLKQESLEMARKLRDCQWAYTVAIISNEAISGGALVALGCDEILIDPNAKFGDIGEIGFDPEEGAFRLIEPKIESYLSRDARDLAESKGRSPDLAEAFIDKDVLVYQKPNPLNPAGAPLFQSVRSDAAEKPTAPWELVPETGPERFLTLSGQRTLQLGLAQGMATTPDALANEFNFPKDSIKVYSLKLTDKVAHFLNNPIITALLILFGMVALYFEFSAPGLGVGGLLSGLAAVLFFWSRFLAGTSGWLEVILFLGGVAFIFAELFIIPGFGVSGLTGIALLFISVILAGQNFVLPATSEQWDQSMASAFTLLISCVAFMVAAIFITKKMGSIPILNKMILSTEPFASKKTSTDSSGKPIPTPHPLVSVGDWGESESLLRPAGRAKFNDRSIDVVSDGAFVEAGVPVRVIEIQGSIIRVTQVSQTPKSEAVD